MKKVIILFIATCISCSIHAQVKLQNNKIAQPAAVKTIAPQKATVIRKDIVKLKTQLVQLSDSIRIAKSEIDVLVDKMKNDLDSMSEMGETESLRLQMAMDRLSKMMSTLSNILKKMSDTQSSIVQNLK